MLQKTTYPLLRQSHVLAHYSRSAELLTLLLRVDGKERPEARGRLRELEYEAEQTDATRAISWKRKIPGSELALRSAQICRALRHEVLLDVGSAHLDASGRIHTQLEEVDARCFWPGSCLIYVHRDRSVLFDHDASVAEIERALLEASHDYYAREFSAPAE
jgi:hypothetical protein